MKTRLIGLDRRTMALLGLLTTLAVVMIVSWPSAAQQANPAGAQPDAPKASPGANAPPATMPAEADSESAIGQIVVSQARLRALIPGDVEAIHFLEGQQVKRGDMLVQLGAKDRSDAVATAMKIAATCRSRYEQVQARFKAGNASDSDVTTAELELDRANDVLQQRQEELAKAQIIAPFDGVIGDCQTSVGSTVMPGDPIVIVYDKTHPRVEFRVTADSAHGLRLGNPVEINLLHGSPVLARGEVKSIGQNVDSNTGTIRVVATIASMSPELTPNEFVTVKFHTTK